MPKQQRLTLLASVAVGLAVLIIIKYLKTTKSNALASIQRLRNRYFLVTNGHSAADRDGILSSDTDVGSRIHGLTQRGRQEVEGAASLLESEIRDQHTIVLTSPMLRARETAEEIISALGLSIVPIQKRELTERWFGEFNGRPVRFHEMVLDEDVKNADHCDNRVESINSILSRTTNLIMKLEKRHEDKDIVLVSHKDPLQILLTAFKRGSVHDHMKYDFKTGHVEMATLEELH